MHHRTVFVPVDQVRQVNARLHEAVVPLAQTRKIILRDTPVSMGIQ